MTTRRATSWAATVAITVAACSSSAWVEPTHRWLVEAFSFSTHPLVQLRQSDQHDLLLVHGRIALLSASLLVGLGGVLPRVGASLGWVVWVGYVLRALVWGIGGNWPMVQADSAHHFCIAENVFLGKGPTLDYVASFFRVYARWGMVDDWAMPLNAYYLAGWFCVLGNTLIVAKLATFVVNLATIPLFYWTCRRWGQPVARCSAWTLALFPPHILVASWILKESLTCFMTLLAVEAFLWCWSTDRRQIVLSAAVAGVVGGLMALSRQTGLAVLAAMALDGLLTPTPRRPIRWSVWVLAAGLTIAPWAWVTYRDYGTPLYSYANYFKYTPSWPDHWIKTGVPTLHDYLQLGLVNILRTKSVMVVLLVVYSVMVFSPILTAGLVLSVRQRWRAPAVRLSLLIALAFVAGTLVNIASLDQVRDYGRYFPPVLLLLTPIAWAGLADRFDHRSLRWVMALLAGFFVGAYSWTDNYRLLSDDWHLQYARYRQVASSIHDAFPADAIVMAHHPWEIRLLTGRRSVLMPRNYDPQRIVEEIRRYGVTAIVLDRRMASALPAVSAALNLGINWEEFSAAGIAVYSVKLDP